MIVPYGIAQGRTARYSTMYSCSRAPLSSSSATIAKANTHAMSRCFQVQGCTGVYPRVLYDTLFGYIPGWRQVAEAAGGAKGTSGNCTALMSEVNSHCLLLESLSEFWPCVAWNGNKLVVAPCSLPSFFYNILSLLHFQHNTSVHSNLR